MNLQILYKKNKQWCDTFMRQSAALGQSNNAEELFYQMCFCLLTPQVNADEAEKICSHLRDTNILFQGSISDMESSLGGWGYRFPDKAKYLYEARKRFFDKGCEQGIVTLVHGLSSMRPVDARKKLVDNVRVRGLGMKTASHFLRNLGLSHNELAILDRYILSWLEKFGVISKDEAEQSLTKRRYLHIERRMKDWNDSGVHIPLDILDLLLWRKF